MAEFKRIPINQITIPERLRAVEEDQALVIAQSIVEHGLINPITVRRTNAAKEGNYTLVAGAHRIRAYAINGDERDIDAMIVDADKAEGQLVEITENLFRNELSAIDRATFVASYRQIWEQKYGKIEAGRPGNRSNIVQLIAEEAVGSFAQHVADRMGISKSALKYLNQISQKLHPDVRDAVRGTPVADNQSALLKLAKLEPKKQRQAAVALRAEAGDLKRALAAIDDTPRALKEHPQKIIQSRLLDTWSRADKATRRFFLIDISVDLGIPKDDMNKMLAGLETAK
ncbi:ParB N-terminal domain-containing protein [Rhizobium herbae]